jgi:dipeptidyl aminopeptidase/acylaminoacyl peptidase
MTRLQHAPVSRRKSLSLLATCAAGATLVGCDLWTTFGKPDGLSPGGSRLSIPALRVRTYGPGEIRLHDASIRRPTYTSYIMTYRSEELRVTGIASIPVGSGPFPVILLNHGYALPSRYETGEGTRVMSDVLASRGFVTLASDYRGLGGSDDTPSLNLGIRLEFAIDVLNLAAAARSLPEAQPGPIGIWGHSLGGELALRAAAVDRNIGPVAVWAPMSPWMDDLAAYYRLPASQSSQELRATLSTGNYLSQIRGPIDIHQGAVDQVVNPAWARKIHHALLSEGIRSTLHLYPDQGHLLDSGTRTVVSATTDFFEKNFRSSEAPR